MGFREGGPGGAAFAIKGMGLPEAVLIWERDTVRGVGGTGRDGEGNGFPNSFGGFISLGRFIPGRPAGREGR